MSTIIYFILRIIALQYKIREELNSYVIIQITFYTGYKKESRLQDIKLVRLLYQRNEFTCEVIVHIYIIE